MLIISQCSDGSEMAEHDNARSVAKPKCPHMAETGPLEYPPGVKIVLRFIFDLIITLCSTFCVKNCLNVLNGGNSEVNTC